MRSKCPVFILLLFLSTVIGVNSCFGQAKDTLFLNNGELLIGELKEIVRGRATFDSNILGLVLIKTIKIRTAHTTIGVLRIQTTNDVVVYGKLLPSSNRDTLFVSDGLVQTKLAIKDINSVVAIRRSFFSQIDGNVSAGLSFSHSSGIGQFNLSGEVKHTSRSLVTDLSVNGLGSIDSSKFSRDQEKEQINSYYYINTSSWFVDAGLSHQRNKEMSLSHRYQGLLGGGNKFLTERAVEAYAITGVTFSIEQSIEGVTSDEVEIPLVLRLDYFKFSHPNMQITMTNAGYVSVTQQGRYRYDGNLNFSWELISDFNFNTNIYGNFDSKPLDPGSSKLDYGIVMGLSYKF